MTRSMKFAKGVDRSSYGVHEPCNSFIVPFRVRGPITNSSSVFAWAPSSLRINQLFFEAPLLHELRKLHNRGCHSGTRLRRNNGCYAGGPTPTTGLCARYLRIHDYCRWTTSSRRHLPGEPIRSPCWSYLRYIYHTRGLLTRLRSSPLGTY